MLSFWVRNVMEIVSPSMVILCICYMHMAEGQSFFDFEEEAESRDGYYDNETPQNWVDILFLCLISIHHLEYAFKFTDYSLGHVHLKQQKLSSGDAAEQEQEYVDLEEQHSQRIKRSSERTTLQTIDVFEMFTTESDQASKRRPIHNRLCCCIRFSPRFFTWERTHVIRTILKLFCCISCLLAMVLYVLFFMNLLAEYVITCIVHFEDGYLAALLMIPFLLFACNILIRLAWQSVVASWSMSCDANGDLECSDSDVMITSIRRQMVNRKRLLYTFTVDAREDYWEEDHVPRSKAERMGLNMRNDMSEAAEKAEEQMRLSKMADYFIATCWRFGFFFYSMIFACLASMTLQIEVALNAFFWQLAMRYCVLAGVSWTIVYTVCSLLVAVVSRYRTWKIAHQEIPRYKLFLLIDAQDTEESNKNWMRLKVAVMCLSLILGFGMIIVSYVFIDASWSSFVHFCGIIWLLYYLANLFMSCKPYALVALWTDSIPPPGKNYLAHKIASQELHKKKLLKVSLASKSDVRKHTNTANETIMLVDDDYNDDDHGDDDAGDGNEDAGGADDEKDDSALRTHPRDHFSGEMVEAMIAHEPTNTLQEIELQQATEANENDASDNLKDVQPQGVNGHEIGDENGGAEEEKDEQEQDVAATVPVPNISDDYVPRQDRDPDDIDGGAGGAESTDQQQQLDVVVDNLRSVRSTKRILNEKMEQNETVPRDDQAVPEAAASEAAETEQTTAVELPQQLDTASPPQAQDETASPSVESPIIAAAFLSQPPQSIENVNSVSGSSEQPSDVVPLNSNKKKLKTQHTFRENRAQSLERRYEAFKYDYQEVNPEDFMKQHLFLWCTNCKYQRAKAESFMKNYQQYWLNVYRPFDEYDIESQIASHNILAGFKWLKPILQWDVCDMCKREKNKRKPKRKKSCGETTADIFAFFMNNFCNLCILVTVFLFMFGLFQTAQRLSGHDQFVEKIVYETNQTAFYGVCSDKFGDLTNDEFAQYDLTVLDVTVLTQIAYEASRYDLCETIDNYFNGSFELVKIHREEPFYFHIRHKHAPLDFIAIRGTSNLLEMTQDLSLFIEVVIYETLQWIVPFLNGLPLSFSRQIIYYASYIEGVINSDVRQAFDEPVFEYAKQYLLRLESDCSYNDSEISDWNGATTLYFVGHSLGGAISEIVAANLHQWNKKNNLRSHVQSFGVASPGVLYSSAKFGFGIDALDKTSSSLLPRRDLVSAVDSHGGSIQYTECSADYFHTCHQTDNVLCEVFYGCPEDLAHGAKKLWLQDFCETSSGSNETLGKAQIGQSMRRVGSNITKVIDWELSDIVKRCDADVYAFCNAINTEFEETCSQDFSSWDICYSESQIGGAEEE
eukprot:CAMPEP_0202690286 /NCGR_PEP_ID=MMETSP1385-20130828/5306_1 /ASSEMBLY_ACC=CAM_ASM_000861 /TAXON_ID=933848 /ORGANISM="Elphidium margaritaceum" /LENGTH=1358 /DNA_ID=CAMNT_0049345523 /DNA_START=37 /DNA_END=4113 /DNA_ORIENTATION=+